MIKAVVFDYAGVIELSEKDVTLEVINILAVSVEEWKEKYKSWVHLCNSGEKSWFEIMLLVAAEFTNSSEILNKIKITLLEGDKRKKINIELIEFIGFLKKKGFKTGILSNFTSELRERLIKQGILDLFDVVVASGDVGYQKPSSEIFSILLNNLKISGNELLFIDDSNKSFVNSSEIGFKPLLFKNNLDLKKDILTICSL